MSSCACGVDAAIEAAKAKTETDKKLQIDLLYLDLEVCDPCQATEASLNEALEEAESVLRASGYRTELNRIHIATPELAIAHRFVSSPTIRINGRDIQLESKEAHCETCSSLTDGESVDCRVWHYEGTDYHAPPKALIVDAILRHISEGTEDAGEAEANAYTLPENIRRFFTSKKSDDASAACCTSSCSC